MRLPGRLRRVATLSISLVVFFIWLLHSRSNDLPLSGTQYPLLSKYLSDQRRYGGAWYIPLDWTSEPDRPRPTIVEAAEFVVNQTRSTPERQIPYSTIPLIIHQTWKTAQPQAWPEMLRRGAEKWLRAAEDRHMAYFLWDDAGIAQFIRRFEPDVEDWFYALPSNVERSDVFRILVCKWIGGVYSDMDTEPIRNPVEWIASKDLEPWQDPETGVVYNSTEKVKAIVGLEADYPPDSDTYWRMGYSYPVQLTQWSFACSPGHPILQGYIDQLSTTLRAVSSNNNNQLQSSSAQRDLYDMYPVTLTGPGAFTTSVQRWLESTTGLRWNALSGLEDGGLSKLVGDILVLPITGFSPGRGQYGDMGSKPITDPSARLIHHAQGSWRKFSLLVEYGKFCRAVFGRCKNWSKVPHSLIT